MVELDDIPQSAREQIEKIGAADLVIGIVAPPHKTEPDPTLANVREAVAKLYTPVRTVVIQPNPPTDQDSPEDGVRVLPYPLVTPEALADPVRSVSIAYHAAFAVSENLGARACAVIASNLETITAQWIYRLLQPLLELDFDLVTPCYAHRKFEGLLNSSVVAPLTRALYGKRIQHPLGPDFGFSGRLVRKFLASPAGSRAGSGIRPLTALAIEAVCEGFEICEAHVGARLYPPTDWMNQSSVLAQILGPLFSEVEQNAAFWQRIRGSEPIPAFGEGASVQDDPAALDIGRMIDSFQLGYRNLQDIWSIVLPPGTLLELNRLARQGRDQFRMPDALWVRIIYDFALGHRLRTINPDHLLRAMTPLFLAWVASFALESETAPPAAVEERLEQLGRAYEAGKPYVLSRWRWPDRFNP